MNEAVRTVVHQMGMNASEYTRGAAEVARANEQLVQSTARVVVEEEKVERATRTTADSLGRLDARVDAAIRAEQRRVAALAQVARAVEEGTATQERAAQTIARVNAFYDQQVAAANRARAANQNLAGAMIAANTNTRGFGSTIQQAGFQIGDFAVQVASGQSAVRAFIQQGSQFLGAFGPIGAILGAAVAVVGALATGFGLLGGSTDDAADAQDKYTEALKKAAELTQTAEERARALAEAKRQEALETLRAAEATERDNLAKAAVARDRAAGVVSRLEAAQASGRDVTAGLEAARTTLAGIDQIAEETYNRLGPVLQQIERLNDPSQIGKAREEHEKRARAIETEREKVDALIKSLELEVETQGMSNRQKEMRIALDRAGAAATDEQRRKILELIDAKHNHIDTLKKQEEAERKAAEAAKKAAEDQKRAEDDARRAAERAQKEFDRQIERGTDRVVGQAADILYDAFTGRIRSIGDTLKATLLRAVAEATAQMVIRPIVQPLVASAIGAFSGGGASSAGGGFGGGLFNLGSMFNPGLLPGYGGGMHAPGTGGLFSGIGSLFSPTSLLQGGGLFSPLTSLGGAAAGLFGLSVAGPSTMAAATSLAVGPGGLLAGGGATSLAAGSGAMLSPLAATGIGAAIALPLILGASGLFSKKSSGPQAVAHLGFANGQFTTGVSAADNGGDTSGVRQGIGQVAQQLNAIMSAYGLGVHSALPGAGRADEAISYLFGGAFGLHQGSTPGNQATTPEELISRVLGLRGLFTGTGQIGIALRNTRATTLEQFTSDLDLAKMLDPAKTLKDALAEVNKQFDEMAKRARALGLNEARLAELRAEQLKITQAQYDAPAIQGIGGVRNFLSGLQISPLSALTPEQQFSEAERRLNAVGGAAAAGDINSVGQFQAYATQYLTLARDRFASSPGYVDAFNKVLGFADRIGSTSEEGWRANITAVQQQTATLQGELKALRDEVVRLRRAVDQGGLMGGAFAA